ncbi:inosine triphosphate pyrophosphatase-like protein [Blastocladiella britannica]|nr:inosine triphosphate pyrophosphatase-like protein [Blastocladiella britannica]
MAHLIVHHRPLALAPCTPPRPLTIVLGSSSKFRRGLLGTLLPNNTDINCPVVTLTFDAPDIDEAALGVEDRQAGHAEKLTTRLAHAKADALEAKWRAEHTENNDDNAVVLLITSDQVIRYDGTIREKPESPEQCKQFLASYVTHPAETVAAVVVTDVRTGTRLERVVIGRQAWKPVPEDVADAVIAKGDIMYCAGGFMIDEPLLYAYLGDRDGDPDTIIGMPLAATREMLEAAYAVAINE